MAHNSVVSGNKGKVLALRVARIAGWIFVLAALLAGGGLVFQSVSETRDSARYTAPGKMVDIGGYQLHLHCTGAGSPTVVLESGLGGPALMWALVQEKIQGVTRVCSYDRAGLGWSDAGPSPRTSRQMADERHALLHKAGIEGPYVLVGHSLGAFIVRLSAHEFPQETAGMVLVAGGSENDNTRMPPEYRKIEESNLQSNRLFITLSRLGLVRAAGAASLLSSYTSLLAKFPGDLRAEFIALTFYRTEYWITNYSELSAAEDRAQVAAAGSLGDLPLVVVSGSPDVSRLPPSFPVEQIRQTFQDLELAALSSQSIHIICDTCDHYIPMTDPDKVVEGSTGSSPC